MPLTQDITKAAITDYCERAHNAVWHAIQHMETTSNIADTYVEIGAGDNARDVMAKLNEALDAINDCHIE